MMTVKELLSEYVLIGCVDGCRHRLPDTFTERILPRLSAYQERIAEQITCRHCSKNDEHAEWRRSVYDRADKAYIEGVGAHRSFVAWRKIADEYTKRQCPFFEKAA